jgi:hypothetical protein
MVAALERPGLAALGRAELGAAVTAHVEERAERAVVAADDENAFVADPRRAVVAGRGELVHPRDADPEPSEEASLLELPHLGVVVEAPGQGARQAAAGVRRGLHGVSPAGNTMTFRSVSPPSIATIASLIRSRG